MTITFCLLAALTILGTAAAMSLRNLVHCLLALMVGLISLAAIYLELGAQFVGLAQILVYVGAVAILAMFAIMMTRGSESTELDDLSSLQVSGGIVAILVFATLSWTLIKGTASFKGQTPLPQVSVQQIGSALMYRFVLPMELLGLLLTAALIGAAVLAMDESEAKH